MFDQRLAYTAAALIIVGVFSFVISGVPQKPEATPITENVAGIERQDGPSEIVTQAPPESLRNYEYLLKEHNGRIAVFPAGQSEPEMVLDVLVKYLPDYDRTQMKDGIPVKDYDELVRMIEDYVS